MALTRRDFIKAGLGAGALLVAGPQRLFGGTADAAPGSFPVSRTSRLFPGNGRFVVHSDLHNHSLNSDGHVPAEEVFARMRAVELDAAALTDHALFGKAAGKPCSNPTCNNYLGIDEASWKQTEAIANANNDDGAFVAMRGFEWTTGTIGHVNVWFTETWVDSATTLGLESPRGLNALFEQVPELGSAVGPALGPLVDQLPETATMDLFYKWLQTEPSGVPFGGGADGLAGFNHPNEYGNFESFKFVPGVLNRIVSCEALNMDRDFLFWGFDKGMGSPLNACLNACWRVGMLGVSDEHYDQWGHNRARGGLWVDELTRAGVRRAMEDRRMFATFERGLRLDAAANGVQMGRDVPHTAGPMRIQLDIEGGDNLAGRPFSIQVLRPGTDRPAVAHAQDLTLPAPVITMDVPVDIEDGKWVLVRVSDRSQPADAGTPDDFKGFGRGIAYASPFFLVSGSSASVLAASAASASPAGSSGAGSVAGAPGGQLPETGG